MSLKICERERERQYFKVSASATNFDERTKALPICRLEQVLEIQTSFFSRKIKGRIRASLVNWVYFRFLRSDQMIEW